MLNLVITWSTGAIAAQRAPNNRWILPHLEEALHPGCHYFGLCHQILVSEAVAHLRVLLFPGQRSANVVDPVTSQRGNKVAGMRLYEWPIAVSLKTPRGRFDPRHDGVHHVSKD
jgi:hypothetical protein